MPLLEIHKAIFDNGKGEAQRIIEYRRVLPVLYITVQYTYCTIITEQYTYCMVQHEYCTGARVFTYIALSAPLMTTPTMVQILM